MSENLNILKNIGKSTIFKILSIIISFMIIPYYLNYLSSEKYGIWLIILNLLNWINIFDIGIGNGLKNHLVKAFYSEKKREYNDLISTAYIFNTFIISIGILVISFLIIKIDISKSLKIEGIVENLELKILLLITIFLGGINFILNLVNQLYYSIQKSYIIELKQFFCNLIILILTVFPLIKNENNKLLYVGVSYNFTYILTNLILTLKIFNEKKIRISIKSFKKEKLIEINSIGYKFFIMQVASLILFSTSNFLISNLFSIKEVTNYNILFKLYSSILIGHQIIINTLWPAFAKNYVEKNYTWIKSTMKKLYLLEIGICLSVIVLIFITPSIIHIWLGYPLQVSLKLRIAMACYIILLTSSNNYTAFFCGISELDMAYKIAILQGVINIPVAIFLIKILNFGIEGIVHSINFSLLIYFIYAIFYYKKIEKKLK